MTYHDTYAERWSADINETYHVDTPHPSHYLTREDLHDGEDFDAAVRRTLTKALRCLGDGHAAAFTGAELDLVRHLMPAHEITRAEATLPDSQRSLIDGVLGARTGE
jgi:hypothetical protein